MKPERSRTDQSWRSAIEEFRRLVAKYPNGLDDFREPAENMELNNGAFHENSLSARPQDIDTRNGKSQGNPLGLGSGAVSLTSPV